MSSSLFLLMTSVGTVGVIFTDSYIYPALEFLGLIGFILLEFRQMSRMAHALLVLSLFLPLQSLATGSFDSDLFLKALHRGAFFAFFLTSLGFLQYAAGLSPLIQSSGRILVMQPPGRRYIVLTFGAAVFSVLMNLGTVGLLGTMIIKGVENGRDAAAARIADIRRKRMTLAMMRGFCSLPMWSPITITIALVTSSIPGLTWGTMVIYSAPMAVVFLMFGWFMDRRAYPRAPAQAPSETPSLLGLVPLVAIVVLVPGSAYAVSILLDTNLITALLVCLPWISIGWLFIQRFEGTALPALRAALGLLATDLLPTLPNIRTEIALFACSAFIGVMVTASVDTDALGQTILGLGLASDTLLVLSAWLVVGLSVLGMSPIISVTILAGTLPKLEALNIDPVAVGVMLLTVWAISVNITPFSAAVRFSARMINVPPTRLGLIWNGLFALSGLVMLTVFLLIFQ